MNTRRVEFLDGIRGLCALWVVLSHVWIFYHGLGPHHGVLGWLTNWLLYSHFAVDVFIVLSGYCLAISAYRNKPQAADFFRRRAIRILPPVFAALAAAIAVRAFAEGMGSITAKNVFSNALLLQDALPSSNVFDVPLWSVAVEWRLYFLFPLIFWALTSYLDRRGMVTVGAVAVGFGLTLTSPVVANCYPWFLGLFAAGVYAASDDVRPDRSALLAMAAGAFVVSQLVLYPINAVGESAMRPPLVDTGVGLLAAALLVVIRRQSTPVWVLTRRPLLFLGEISFSLYLIHAVAAIVLFKVFKKLPAEWLTVDWVLVGFPLIFLAAFVFHRCVERPSMRAAKSRARAVVVSTEEAQPEAAPVG